MSIIIKDMDMPNSCKDCPFNSDNAWCLVPGNWRDRYYIPESGRSEFCPLQYSEDKNDSREFIETLINNIPDKDKPHSGKETEEKQMRTSESCPWLDSSIKRAYEKYNVLYSTSK